MQRDQLDRLFEQTRQMPEEVSYAHIEKLVMLQPVVPIAAAKVAVWWKTKIFLNTITVSVLTTAATGVVYMSTGTKDTKAHTTTAPASLHTPEKEALPVTIPAPAPAPVEPQEIATQVEETVDTTVTQEVTPVTDLAPVAPLEKRNVQICKGANATAVGASISAEGASVVYSEGNGYSYAYSSDGSGNDVSEADGSSSESGSAAPDDYRSYDEEAPPQCNCQHATDSIWECIERSLISESLINVNQRWYKFYLTPTQFEINDNKITEDVAIRYRAMYERLSGETLSKHYKIEVLIDNSKNQKRYTIEQRN